MSLDATITPGQLGHITDHQVIAAQLNAVPTSYVAKGALVVNVKDYGVTGDGVTDDSTALQALIDLGGFRTLFFPRGNYKCNNITIAQTAIRLDGDHGVTLVKNGNGPVLILNASDIAINVKIAGAGATYPGVGIEVQTATNYQIRRPITDTASYCVDHTVNDGGQMGAIAGPLAMSTTGNTSPCIRYPPNEFEGDRSIHAVMNGGGTLVDFAGCATTLVTNCVTAHVLYGANSKKVAIVGSRIASGGLTTTVYGTSHVIAGSIVAGPVVLDTASNQCFIAASYIVGGVTNNGATSNSFPVVRAAAITSPAADAAALKTAVDAIRAALTAAGITL